MKTVLRSSLDVFLRTLMVSALAFASYPLVAAAKDFGYVISCVLAVFYYLVFMYFCIFNLWTAGEKDKIKVNAGHMKPMVWKGFVSDAVVFVPTAIVYTLANVLPKNTLGDVFRIINVVLTEHSMYIYSMFRISNSGGGLTGALITAFFCLSGTVAAGVSYIVGFKGIKIIQPWLDQWKKN